MVVGVVMLEALRIANDRCWLNPILTLPLAKRPLPAMEADITRWWPVRQVWVMSCRTAAPPRRSAPWQKADQIGAIADVATRRSALEGKAVVAAPWPECRGIAINGFPLLRISNRDLAHFDTGGGCAYQKYHPWDPCGLRLLSRTCVSGSRSDSCGP